MLESACIKAEEAEEEGDSKEGMVGGVDWRGTVDFGQRDKSIKPLLKQSAVSSDAFDTGRSVFVS